MNEEEIELAGTDQFVETEKEELVLEMAMKGRSEYIDYMVLKVYAFGTWEEATT